MGDTPSLEDARKKKQKEEPKCLYCNRAPMSQHEGLTCPRISGVILDENWNVYSVEFMDPRDWAVFLKECDQD